MILPETLLQDKHLKLLQNINFKYISKSNSGGNHRWHTPCRIAFSDLRGNHSVLREKTLQSLSKKKRHMFKNWPLVKNPQFFSNPHET